MATGPPAWKVLLLALGFVELSLACKLVPCFGLGFLAERSIVRSGVAGLVALAATVVMTALALRWPRTRQLAAPHLVLLPAGAGGLRAEAVPRAQRSRET